MKRSKKRPIMGIVVIAAVALVFAGYNLYRYPAMLRNLEDRSLTDSKAGELRNEILSRSDTKILVAYFSYSGTTRGIANAISEKTGGSLFEITPKDGYSGVYPKSNREIRRNERPVLADTVENMEEYDIVFVGYPVWWHATPAPVNTFLESYDLAGKLIIPFCTSGGSDIDETMPTFLNSCDGLAVYGERRISGTSVQQSAGIPDDSEISSYESVAGTQIKMITENTEVVITLNDSRAAADLAAMLPLELTLIERNGFAQGMTLPDCLSSTGATTREYEIGDFGYWNAGPDLAIFYDDIYEQTIVEVIPLGHAQAGAETMADEAGTVRLELVKEEGIEPENSR